jgi:penicillin-binding protein 2
VPVPVRYYPSARSGAHVLGYMAEVDAEKLAELRALGYMEGDRIGVAGIERAWESYLRGTRGREKVLVDARGRRQDPGGTGIIEDPTCATTRSRGAICASRSTRRCRRRSRRRSRRARRRRRRGRRAHRPHPRPVLEAGFDPAALSGGSGKQVIRDAFPSPLLRSAQARARQDARGAYPPGSTFKPFTALAALEKGLIDPRMTSQCRGGITFGKRAFRCTHVHGATDLHKAIAESCNVYFYRSRPNTASAWTSSPRWASASASARRPASA